MLDPTIHKRVLLQILKAIFSDFDIGPIVGFKGGTAAFLFYDLDRFSVDLDFDLLVLERELEVFEKMISILKRFGELKRVDRKRFSLVFILGYFLKADTAQNIKVEINLRQFGSKFEIKNYLGIPMKVMAPADMVAHKLVAFYERAGKTNRDIYDAWFFLEKRFPINLEMIEKRTGLTPQSFFKTCLDRLNEIHDSHILAGMGELLTDSQKVWVKKNLRKELIFQIQLLTINTIFQENL
jgi:predicted nucleotidyltransferase component of viral defense system